jgi:hypothetical protein
MTKTRLLILSVTVLCLGAAPAMADLYGTLDVEWKGLIRGYSNLRITSPFELAMYTESNVGLHLLKLGALDTTGATHTLPANSYLVEGLVQVFCIDLDDGIPVSTREYNAVSLDSAPDYASGAMGDAKAKYIAQLLNTNTYGTDYDAAVVQVAIWEILHDDIGSWDTTTGNFYLDTGGNTYGEAAIASAANTMLSGLSQASSFSQYTAISQSGRDAQDFVLVPTPAAILLGILGLGVAGLKLRKFA